MSTAPFSADEYATWAENPVTVWVMKGVKDYAEAQAASWLQQSWNTGEADQRALDKLRVRADAYEGLAGLTYEQACGANGQEPQKEAA